MGSESSKRSYSYADKVRQRKIICICLSALLALVPLLSSQIRGSNNSFEIQLPGTGPVSLSHHIEENKKQPLDISPFEHCADFKFNAAVAPVGEVITKPIWFIAAPNRVSNSLHSTLINTMTGLGSGGKNFIAKSSGLKHCIGKGQTATCLASSDVNPDQFDFYGKAIVHVRNPFTGFPASYNLKSQLYRGLEGQNPIEEWRNARDAWSYGMIEEFKTAATAWTASKVDVGMYLVHEDLYDIEKGVEVMKKLRNFLFEAGFPVVPEEDLSCVWYNTLGNERITNYHNHGYEYGDYVPAYTKAQKVKYLKELEEVKKTVENDMELAGIIDRYIKESETETDIDEFIV
jgi:hypothetical protein